MKKILIRCILLVVLVWLLWSEALVGMDHQFIFFPTPELTATPASVGLEFRAVEFRAADGVRLHGWLIPGEAGRPLVLFCHGNAGNISHRVDNLLLLHQLGLSVFIFDYRGYGQSEGRADEDGTYQDARAALVWLGEQGYAPQQMIYFGRSLGAAIAVQMALERPPAALILESPFPSIASMGRHHNPLLYLLLGWTLQSDYDNLGKLSRIHVPLLMLQGERDDIVTPAMARNLFEKANEPKTFYLIPGAGHNDTLELGGKPYWDVWRRFLNEVFEDAGFQLSPQSKE